MRNCKSSNYANHTPELSVHVYGFSSAEERDELAERIKQEIIRFSAAHKSTLERKITLD